MTTLFTVSITDDGSLSIDHTDNEINPSELFVAAITILDYVIDKDSQDEKLEIIKQAFDALNS